MNSDSFLDSDFFQDNKAIITILTTVSLAFLTIYWLYRGLKPEEANPNINDTNFVYNQNNDLNARLGNNSVSNENINNVFNKGKAIVKRRLMINASSFLIDDLNNIDVARLYQFLSPLQEIFDLYIVFMINDDKQIQNIHDKLEPLITDKIIFKHVSNICISILLNT